MLTTIINSWYEPIHLYRTGGCYNDPCLNGGLCNEVLDDNNPLAYRCSCPMGFTGVNCESTINYCASRPCKNSGWCTSMTTGFTCTCLQGYTGMTLYSYSIAERELLAYTHIQTLAFTIDTGVWSVF